MSDKIIKHYGNVDHEKGPKIYTRQDMFDAIYQLGDFGSLPTDKPSSFLDMMCGVKCLVATKMKEMTTKDGIDLDTYCLDLVFGDMEPDKRRALEEKGLILKDGDITQGVDYSDGTFQRAAERFGVKNYQPDTQKEILSEVRRILSSDGYFVIADMIAPETSYGWMQEERHRKSRHTVGEENAFHHVPTLGMWFDMLKETGYEPNVDDVYQTLSKVDTANWVASNQMSEEGRADMNSFLLDAPSQSIKDFNIREEGGTVKIDYPVVVIGAKKVN